jgi:hypothetical protein
MNEEKKEKSVTWYECLKMTSTIVLSMTIFILVISLLNGAFSSMTCSTLQAMNTAPGYQYQWGFWTGCRVHIPSGLWVPQSDLDKYIAVDPAPTHLPKEFLK